MALGNAPYHVALIPVARLEFGGMRDPDAFLAKVAARLNLRQKLFHYQIFGPTISLGEYPDQFDHGYLSQQYYDELKRRISASSYLRAIAITPEELEQGSFNRHDHAAGVGVITINGYKNYVPPGCTMTQYLSYLILCESLCLVAGQHFEHRETWFCLFDMCHRKSDLTDCLRRPYIHKECCTRLKAVGFTDPDIAEANKLLAFVGEPNWWHILGETFRHPATGLVLGAAIALWVRIIVELSIDVASAIAASLLLVFLAVTVVNYVRARPRLPPQTM